MNNLVSIIIVNYNGYHLLKNCLKSIFNNKYLNFEIIIADNGSTDNSISQIKTNFKKHLNQIKIIDLKKNLGPALARNLAFKKSKGEVIAFLDNDTQVDKNWINQIIPIFQKKSNIGIVQSKLLLMNQPKKLDYVGEYLGNLGFLKSIANYGEIDKHQYDKVKYILAAKSAGMFVSRQAFIDAGMFDPSYFIFTEETDLGWRVWLSGYQNILSPKSIVYHKFSSTKDIVDPNFNNFLVRFHGTKNYIQTLIKNLEPKYLIKILPIHVLLWFLLASYLLITGKFNSAKNIYHGILWNIIHLKENLLKRKKIQSQRKVSDNYLFKNKKLLVPTNLNYYIQKFFSAQKQITTPENAPYKK